MPNNDDSKVQFDVELNENSVESSFKAVDERAAKSAKESAAVFGEAFERMENDLKDGLARIVKETSKDSMKSAKESASVFSEAFKKQEDEIVKAQISLTDFAAGWYLLKEAANVAGSAMDSALQFVVNGEQELKLDKKFETLAMQAGIAADVIRNELTDATKGLVEESKLLELGSEAFIQLGKNASALPQILELARKTYAVFGGDVVSNTEKITNAIFTGQTRQLKQLGLIVDAEKIYKNYARSIGTVVPLLTEQQRQTAILNEVLAQGAEKYKNVNAETGKVSDATTRYAVQIKALNDELSILVSNTFGKTIAGFFEAGANSLKDWNRIVAQSRIETMPDGIDKINFAIKTLSESIEYGEKRLESFNKTEMRTLGPTFTEGIEAKKVQLAGYQKQLEEIAKKQAEVQGGGTPPPAPAGGGLAPEESAEFIRRREELVMKVQELNAQVQASDMALAQDTFNRNQNAATLDSLYYQQRLQSAETYQTQKAQLEKFYADNGIINDTLRNQGREALEQQHLNRLAQIQAGFNEYSTQGSLSVGESFGEVMEGIEDAAMRTSLNAGRNFRNLGNSMMMSIGNAAGNAFAAFGQAIAEGENALEAFGKALLNSLGQMAIQVGSMFILQGIGYTYAGMANGPPLIAAGAALAALGGFLSVVGGVGPRGVVGGGSAGGGMGREMTSPITEPIRPEDTQAQIPKTEVNLTINGNVLDRRQTGLEIAQILEEQFAEQGLSIRGAA